jgi:hypothetical protein
MLTVNAKIYLKGKERITQVMQLKNYKLTFTALQNIHPHRKVKCNIHIFIEE